MARRRSSTPWRTCTTCGRPTSRWSSRCSHPSLARQPYIRTLTFILTLTRSSRCSRCTTSASWATCAVGCANRSGETKSSLVVTLEMWPVWSFSLQLLIKYLSFDCPSYRCGRGWAGPGGRRARRAASWSREGEPGAGGRFGGMRGARADWHDPGEGSRYFWWAASHAAAGPPLVP